MTTENKSKLQSSYFQSNWDDYLLITKKISGKNRHHFDISPEDILSIIYDNIYKRLDRIPDRFFENKNQFRSIFIKTLQSQILWSVSDIQQFKTKLKSFITPQQSQSDTKINGEYIFDESQEPYQEDDHEAKLKFLNEDYKLTCTPLEKATHEIIFEDRAYINSKFSEKTKVDLTTSAKFIRNYKNKVRFTYNNIDKINDKKSIGIINELHPIIAQTIIDTISSIESNEGIEIKIVRGTTQEKLKHITWFSFGLACEFDSSTDMQIIAKYFPTFELDSYIIVYQPSITLDEAKLLRREKKFIKGTNHIILQ